MHASRAVGNRAFCFAMFQKGFNSKYHLVPLERSKRYLSENVRLVNAEKGFRLRLTGALMHSVGGRAACAKSCSPHY
jgi:hypothetical protein